jgi:hypothetical protein
MKLFGLTVLLILILVNKNTAFAQDLIVGISGDSLNCFILKETEEKVHFTTKVGGVFERVNLPKDQIKTIKKSFYQVFEEPEIYSNEQNDPFNRVRISLEYGRSKIFDQKLFNRNRNSFFPKSNYSINANSINFSGSYFFNKKIGLGLDMFYIHPNQEPNYKVSPGVFLGPGFFYRGFFESNAIESITSISPGVVFFTATNQLTYNVAFVFSECFEQSLSNNLSLGIGGKFYFALYGEKFIQLNLGIKYNFLED